MNKPDKKLFDAIREKDMPMLLEAYNDGADLTARNEMNNTPLMMASVYGFMDGILFLIDKNVDINAKNLNNNHALIIAASLAHAHKKLCVEPLLKHGADHSIENNDGLTALIHAVMSGEQETVKCLLDYGADPEYRTKTGLRAIYKTNNRTQTDSIIEIREMLQDATSKKILKEQQQAKQDLKIEQTIERHKHQANFRRFALNRGHKR